MSIEENSSIKEQALHPEQAGQREPTSEGSNDPVQLAEPLDDRIYRALLAAADKKAIAPVLLGAGEHLLGGLNLPALGYECVERIEGARATHVTLQKRA